MTRRVETFEISKSPRVEFGVTSGDVTVVAGEPGTVRVDMDASDRVLEAYDVELVGGDTVVIRNNDRRRFRFGGSVDLILTVPEGTELEGRSGSGDITVGVACGRTKLSTGAGDVRLDDVGDDLDIKTGSGDIRIGTVSGDATVKVGSGDVKIGRVAQRMQVVGASGDIRVGTLDDRGSVKTAAGDVSIGRFAGSDLDVKTLAGDVRVGVPDGRRLDVDLSSLSGDLYSAFDTGASGEATGPTASIRVTTMSGDVNLVSAFD